MLKPSVTTIITSIVPGRVDAVRCYLRNHADPRYGGHQNLLQCQDLFRFDKISGLHFCSFTVLDGDAEFPPSLIFEATFDGSRSDFLRELWRVAPEGLNTLYKDCVDYPSSGLDIPELVEEYLIRHDVGAHTVFLGSPGRLVSQIQGEDRIRNELVTYLSCQCAKPDTASLGVLQKAMQRDVIGGRPENRWAEQPAPVPWEIAYRAWVVAAAVLVGLLALCAIGVLVIDGPLHLGPARAWLHCLFGRTWQLGVWLTQGDAPGLSWLGSVINQLRVLPLVILLAAAWAIVRVLELIVRAWTENPHEQYFIWRFPLQLLIVFKYVLPVFLVGFVVLGLFSDSPGCVVATSEKPAIAPVDNSASGASLLGGKATPPAPLVSFVLLLAMVLVWTALSYWATSLKLAVEFQELTPAGENWRLFLLDLMRFAKVVALVVAAIIIVLHLPSSIQQRLGKIVPPTYVLLEVTVYVVVGLLAVYVAALCLLLVIRTRELMDRHRFKDAEHLLTEADDNALVYAREEGGINRYQNHLASLTYVKPGFVRRWALRATLFVVKLLSRFWFNRGELGGIPTILSARWVLIDGGRRLLFLDNYSGAWNSYLDEFIDMGAVKGLNAIWSNTFVKTNASEKTAGGRRYNYPHTRFYFWRGAQDAPAFKAYVRQSQVETLAWYSAYPRLNVYNINMNTELRQSLFAQLSTCDLDRLVNRL
jgi:hypothetical protein